MFAALDISTSAMVAQRTRLNAVTSNIANISTTQNENGEAEAYQPRFVVFQTDDSLGSTYGAAGVQVASVQTADLEPNWRYEPGHPDAVKEGPREGYVAYPNIDLTTEFVDALEATRAYEANVGVVEISKDLANQTLRILA
jgi:flagellar basal-body rod protein FlgC